MGEIQIITGTPKECQKLLNQWRHQFYVVIHKQNVVVFENSVLMIITVERNAK